MSYRSLLITLGAALILLGSIQRGWLLVAIWLGVDFLIVGIAYGRQSPAVFGKRSDGTLPLWSRSLFFPLVVCNIAIWHLYRFCSREPSHNVVTDRLVVGRRLLASEVEGEFDNYVDLTAEFSEPWMIRGSSAYCCFPILDGAAPTPEALREAIANLRPGRTFIHCAQGHGRAGLFALAVLLSSRMADTVEDGLQMLKAVRPGIHLNKEQNRCIQMFAEQVV